MPVWGENTGLGALLLGHQADGDVELGRRSVEGEARVALEQALPHDEGDALGFAQDLAVQIARVVEFEGDALRGVFDHPLGDERFGVMQLAIGPNRNAATTAGISHLVSIIAFAVVLMI